VREKKIRRKEGLSGTESRKGSGTSGVGLGGFNKIERKDQNACLGKGSGDW